MFTKNEIINMAGILPKPYKLESFKVRKDLEILEFGKFLLPSILDKVIYENRIGAVISLNKNTGTYKAIFSK